MQFSFFVCSTREGARTLRTMTTTSWMIGTTVVTHVGVLLLGVVGDPSGAAAAITVDPLVVGHPVVAQMR